MQRVILWLNQIRIEASQHGNSYSILETVTRIHIYSVRNYQYYRPKYLESLNQFKKQAKSPTFWH